MAYLRSFCRGRGAASALEFALLAPALILFVVGIIEFSRFFLVKEDLIYSVDKISRSLNIASQNDSQIISGLEGAFFLAEPENLTVTITRENGEVGEEILISILYDFQFLLPLVPFSTITLDHNRKVWAPL